MIDTVKIVTMIPFNIYNNIQNLSNIKTSYNNKTGEIFYKIVDGHLEGSYNSSLSFRIRRR